MVKLYTLHILYMKKLQRILYNQLNAQYIYDECEIFLLMHHDGKIATWTSADIISLNIYSKLISYAAGKAFAKSMESTDWIQVDSWSIWLLQYAQEHNIIEIVVMDSCESYISKRLIKICNFLALHNIHLDIRPNEQFLISASSFQKKYEKPPIMETFYRRMRKTGNILMEWEKPIWGQRNYDKENRKFDRKFVDAEHISFGENIYWQEACIYYADDIHTWWKEPLRYMPIDRNEALFLLDNFVEHHLDRFGELEDAMYETSDFVHHSLLSIPLNFGLLTPQEVMQAAEKADTAMNNKEGFIRQILGRREYMYHRFHHYKDDIYEQNYFKNTKKLPEWFWWPDQSTLQMNCVQWALEKVDKLWYSHHIERLMVIGNFCMLVWYNPHHVNKRFREQYADAFERVVTPNVLGMSQFADGWKLATKPYVASANYINKMSNHCKTCYYDPKEKYGEKACPLNYLYRNFLNNNQETFKKSRQSFILNHLKKIDTDKISQQSKDFIASLEQTHEKDR